MKAWTRIGLISWLDAVRINWAKLSRKREKQRGIGRDFCEFSLGLMRLNIPREYLNEVFTNHYAPETQGKGQSTGRVPTWDYWGMCQEWEE